MFYITFQFILVQVLDYTGILPVSFSVQFLYCIVSYHIIDTVVTFSPAFNNIMITGILISNCFFSLSHLFIQDFTVGDWNIWLFPFFSLSLAFLFLHFCTSIVLVYAKVYKAVNVWSVCCL